MFILRSKFKDLEARCAWLGEQLTETREELADWKGSALRVADRNAELTRRLENQAGTPSADLLQARAHARALDWRDSSHWSDRELPCRYCGVPTNLRDSRMKAAHKACAEDALATQAADAADAYQQNGQHV